MSRKLPLLSFLLLFAAFSAHAQIPVATIGAIPASGCAPLGVSFTGSSTGSGTTTYSWTFAGGSPATSNLQNPAVLFPLAGPHAVTLVTTNTNGTSVPAQLTINVNPAPIADFNQDNTTGCYPTIIHFDGSTSMPGPVGTGGTITGYTWNFGDGTQDSVMSPAHRYTLAGSFPVTLYVKNNFGCTGSAQIKNVQHAITISGGITPSFTSSLNSSCNLPVTANFSNTSTGPGSLSYIWNFGDGSPTNNLLSPSHPYNAANNYNVSLIVTSSQGCFDTAFAKVNITASGNLTDYSGPDTVCVNSLVTFKNISSPPPNSSTWNFGDGSPLLVQKDGQHIFTTPGTYPVLLTNSFTGCGGSVSKNIVVVNPPTTSFSGTNLAGCAPPLTSTFTNTSTGATSWVWNFGDGTPNYNGQTPPPHTFTSYGDYMVTLTSSSTAGCSSTMPLTVKVDKPIVKINNLPGNGCAPFTFITSAAVTTVDGVASYHWDMGNGNIYTSAAPPPQSYGPGIYWVKLTVTTTGGCSVSDSGLVKVGTIKPIPAFTFVPPTACIKTSIQFTDQTAPGTDNQWLWEFGDGNTDTLQNPKYKYPKPGTYNVRLTAYNNGCWDSLSKSITINPPFAAFSFVTVCNASNSYVFTDKSIGPLAWQWDFGDGIGTSTAKNPTYTYVAGAPVNRTVKLVVTNGACSDSLSQVLTVNKSTTISFSNPAPCVNTIVFFTAIPAGNVSTYVFNFGDGTSSTPGSSASFGHTYTKPGTYPVTVTTTDITTGCVQTSGIQNLTVNGPVANFIPPPAVSCSALTFNFKDLSTDVGSTINTWAWDFGDGGTSTFQNPTYIYKSQGNFLPSLTVTDKNGCSSTLDTLKPIAISIIKAAFNSPDTMSCPGSTVKFNNLSTGGFNPVYNWTFGDGATSNMFGPNHAYALPPTVPTTYPVNLTISDSYGCSATATPVPIYVDTPSAKFTMSGNYSACPIFNDQFTFTGKYAKTYLWDFRDGGISNQPNPINGYALPGDYWPYLTITSPGGCIAVSDSQHVHIDGPVGTFTYNPLAACDSLLVNFAVTTTNVVSFVWYFGDGDSVTTTSPDTSHKYIIPGQYTPIVYITDLKGCRLPKIGQNLINIDAITKADFTAVKSIVCDSGVVSFTDISKLGNGTVVTSYSWDFDDGTGLHTGPFPTIQNDYTVVKNYNPKMTINTAGGCTATATEPVIVAASPNVSIGGIISQCQPGVLNFNGIENVIDPNGPLTWSWDFGNGQKGTGQTPPTVNYPIANNYNIQLIATNTKGCVDTAKSSPPLTIYPIPTINAGPDTTICLGSRLLLNAIGTSTIFNWQPPVDPAVLLSCPACASTFADSVKNSTYFVVKGSSVQGCFAYDTIQVTVNVPPVVNVNGPDSVCLGQNTPLVATGAAIYEWTPSEGLSNPNIGNPIATPTAAQVGSGDNQVITYVVTGYDSKKCFSDVDSVHVTAFNYPAITLTPNATINVGSSYQINSSATTNIVSLDWTPSNTLSCNNCLTPLATPIKTTRYSITAVNDGGCATTDSIRVQVICNGANFFVPNTFSPNGDGVNDYFIVNGKGLNVVPSITIYNRWGQVVFQKSNFAPNSASEAWDGTFNGKPAPSDVYIYTIQILCDNATLIPYHGNVTLIR